MTKQGDIFLRIELPHGEKARELPTERPRRWQHRVNPTRRYLEREGHTRVITDGRRSSLQADVVDAPAIQY